MLDKIVKDNTPKRMHEIGPEAREAEATFFNEVRRMSDEPLDDAIPSAAVQMAERYWECGYRKGFAAAVRLIVGAYVEAAGSAAESDPDKLWLLL